MQVPKLIFTTEKSEQKRRVSCSGSPWSGLEVCGVVLDTVPHITSHYTFTDYQGLSILLWLFKRKLKDIVRKETKVSFLFLLFWWEGGG